MKFIKNTMRGGFRLAYDFFHKLRDCFDPKLYSRKYRVSQTINGNSIHNGPTVAIFVLYQKGCIPFYAKNVLNTLNALDVDVVVSVNEDIGQEQIDWLVNNCCLCVLRKNFGRDFGAYKDAIEILNLEKYQKLLLINDSLIYFSKNLDQLFKCFINSPKNLVTLTENFDKCWHAQTHFLALSRKVFLSNKFKIFWSQYRPFNSRPHSIYCGEIKFSLVVLNSFLADRETIYGSTKIIQSFAGGRGVMGEEVGRLLSLLPDVGDYRSDLIEFLRCQLQYLDNADAVPILEFKKIAINQSLTTAAKNNSSHSFALLSPFVTSTCVIKRDLVFRESYSLSQIELALKDMNIDSSEIESAMKEMTAKGRVSQLSASMRLRALSGII